MSTTDSADAETPVEEARDELQEAVPKAAEALTDLLDAEDETVQIRAAEAVLDRAGLTKAKMQDSPTRAQVQVGGGEREGQGIHRPDPLEDPEDSESPMF